MLRLLEKSEEVLVNSYYLGNIHRLLRDIPRMKTVLIKHLNSDKMKLWTKT